MSYQTALLCISVVLIVIQRLRVLFAPLTARFPALARYAWLVAALPGALALLAQVLTDNPTEAAVLDAVLTAVVTLVLAALPGHAGAVQTPATAGELYEAHRLRYGGPEWDDLTDQQRAAWVGVRAAMLSGLVALALMLAGCAPSKPAREVHDVACTPAAVEVIDTACAELVTRAQPEDRSLVVEACGDLFAIQERVCR